MTSRTASSLVLASGGILLVSGVFTTTDPAKKFKRVYAIVALTLVLSFIADFAPNFAGPLALIFLLGGLASHTGVIGKILKTATS